MERTAKVLGRAALLGGLGGALNAFWCWAKFPVAASDGMDFTWTIIPAGLCHGALLAVVFVACTLILRTRPRVQQWVGLPLTGWVAGWLSFIPIHLYIKSLPVGIGDAKLSPREVLQVFWPFERSVGSLWAPYTSFGLVAVAYYALLILCRQLSTPSLFRHLLMGSVSAAAGSLWWWITYRPWYFSLLHGAVWGSLIGFGVWKSQRIAVSEQRSG